MKVPAFTILEMIVALLLMSIVVSMVYVVFEFMSRNTSNYFVMTQEDLLIRQFYSELQEDVYSAERINLVGDNEFDIVFYNGDVSKYRISNGYLMRLIRQHSDSIPLVEMKLGAVSNQNKIISNISITSKLFEKNIPLYVYKNYYSRRWE